MKRMALLLAVAALTLGFVRRAPHPYHIVFDLSSRDTLDQKMALRLVGEASSNPAARVELVMYGKGFELVMPERSLFLAQVQELRKRGNVDFRVCEIAMKNNQVVKSQLAEGIGTVPDGLYELVSKQQDDWGYIKVVH
jgi:intracellular sulfur oxidation DsrE/DsrF family protein